MKLYYSKGACSLSTHIAINEMGLSCQYESVDLKTKKTSSGVNFLIINPKGAVPTLVLDNEEILTENIAIQQYLADKNKATNLLPAINDFNRYRVIEWLSYIASDIHKGYGPLFSPQVPQDLKDSLFIPGLKNKFEYVDQHLGKHEFLTGHQFTLADCYMFVMLTWLKHFNIALSDFSHLQNYFDTIKARPAVQKALQEEGLNY